MTVCTPTPQLYPIGYGVIIPVEHLSKFEVSKTLFNYYDVLDLLAARNL
jgi:hypothetical protein